MHGESELTDRQKKWFASVREGLVRDTGKTLEEWAAIAKACPETAPRKRLAWMKEHHGLAQNRASLVLDAAFPPETGWSTPDALKDALWKDPVQRAVLDAVEAAAAALPDVIVGQRKGFTAFSRKVQFASVRPLKSGVALGLGVDPAADPALREARNEGWSERLKATLTLDGPAAVDARVKALIRQAWENA